MLLGKLIRAYRKETKISVRKLAKTIGVDFNSLSRFEREKGGMLSKQWVIIVKWALTSEQ